jgi:hypothetical protein
LVEQIAIGAVDFHAVEARLPGVFSAVPVGSNHAGNLIGFQSARGDVGALGPNQPDVPAAAMALGATGNLPSRKTASVTCLQPANCSSVQIPGVSALPTPCGVTAVASVMISPAEAR